jgi:hypothetical protein
MQEGAGPSSTTSTTTSIKQRTSLHTKYDPISLIYDAVSYGEALWNHVHSAINATELINLAYIIEDHLYNLINPCSFNKYDCNPFNPLLASLFTFYSAPELYPKRHQLNPGPLIDQILTSPVRRTNIIIRNYFASLYITESDDYTEPILKMSSNSSSPTPAKDPKSFFVEDLAISEVSDIVRLQMDQDKQLEPGVNDVPIPAAHRAPQDAPVSQRLRINLIRHRFARSSEMTTLKLFKSFVSALRSSDKELTILPFDSKKQRYTSIVSSKQLEQLNEHELKLYFQPWHREQHYSLSGFFHLNTALPFEDLFNEPTIAQWLDTYQYSVKLCPSQAEEMAVIGALCYGSLWMYREDLKMHILQHQAWQEANSDPENPIVFDLIIRQFRGSKKSTQMIFVTAEQSKQDVVREIFKTIYDGSSKAYPRGEMMLFIPTRNGEQYSNEQGIKLFTITKNI